MPMCFHVYLCEHVCVSYCAHGVFVCLMSVHVYITCVCVQEVCDLYV